MTKRTRKAARPPEGQVERKLISELKFDPLNPRLPSDIAQGSDEDIIRYMLDQESLTDLMRSIAEIGFFPGEPLLVFPGTEDYFIVGEGNRRLAALKLLDNPSLARVKSKTVQDISENKKKHEIDVPVIVYSDREKILDYLGYRHITGVEEWDPLSKARYVQQLYKRRSEDSHLLKAKAIARTIGSNAPTVTKILQGIAVVDKLIDLDIINDDYPESKIDFSVLTTALSYQNISEFIGIDDNEPFNLDAINDDNLREFSGWVVIKKGQGKSARNRIGESRNLGALSAIIGADQNDNAALAMFRSGATIEEAISLTTFPSLGLNNMLGEIKAKIAAALTETQKVKKIDPEAVEIAQLISRGARDLASAVSNRINEAQEMEQGDGI